MIYTIDKDTTNMWIRSRLFHHRKDGMPVYYSYPYSYDFNTSYGLRTETIAPTCLEGWSKKYLTDKQT
jgi:hypothetical protein